MKNTGTQSKRNLVITVIAILLIVFAIVCVMFARLQKTERDAERITALQETQRALESYRSTAGAYPPGDGNDVDGWDTPADGTFVGTAVANMFSEEFLENNMNNLRYQRFSAGSFGCPINEGAFYVLGIVDMETSRGDHPLSPAWVCPNRNFQNEMEFVVGKFER
jgi:hypothetical protein